MEASQIAAQYIPFMFGKHTANRQELHASLTKPIDGFAQAQQKRLKETVTAFLLGNNVVIDGNTFRRDVNDASFINAISNF